MEHCICEGKIEGTWSDQNYFAIPCDRSKSSIDAGVYAFLKESNDNIQSRFTSHCRSSSASQEIQAMRRMNEEILQAEYEEEQEELESEELEEEMPVGFSEHLDSNGLEVNVACDGYCAHFKEGLPKGKKGGKNGTANGSSPVITRRVNASYWDGLPDPAMNRHDDTEFLEVLECDQGLRFGCSGCRYRTDVKGDVVTHIGKNLKCSTCGKKMKGASNLVRHERRHTGEKPYKCLWDKCGKVYADAKNLDGHVHKEHLKKEQFQCPYCNSKFWCGEKFQQHEAKKHCQNPTLYQDDAADSG